MARGRRAELVEQLEAIFLERGFSHLTLEALSTELRCSRMTFYAIAPSREQLVPTVLRRFFDDATRQIETRLSQVEPHLRLRACLAGELVALGRMSSTCFQDVLASEATRPLYEAFSDTATDRTVSACAEASGLAADSTEVTFLAELTRLTMDSIYMGEMSERTGLEDRDAVEQLVAVAHAALGLAAPEPPTGPRRLRSLD